MQEEQATYGVTLQREVEQTTLANLETAVDLAHKHGIPEGMENSRPAIMAQNIADQCTGHRFKDDNEFKAVLFWDFTLETQAIPRYLPENFTTIIVDRTGGSGGPIGSGGAPRGQV